MMKNGWLMAVAATVAMAGTAGAEVVDGKLAEAVAAQAVSQFFPGEEWALADGVEVKDGEGERAAWAFVCALQGSGYEDREAVGAAVAAGEDGTDGESELYAHTATVVTGAKDTDSLVFRTFRGLAEWYQEGARGGWKGEAVQVGPGDIRWAPDAPAGARAAGKGATVRKAAAARKARQMADREALPDDLKTLSDEADAEAAEAAKARWGAAAAATRHAERKAALKAAGLAE